MTTADLASRLARIRLVAFDVDGVFTDGRFYLSDNGAETKAFNTQDGYGIRRLLESGIEVAVISGRSSGAVEKRMAKRLCVSSSGHKLSIISGVALRMVLPMTQAISSS